MKRSSERILTTHVGSLPRPAEVVETMNAREQGKPVDEQAAAARVRASVREVVQKQVECGVDVVDDGELGKVSFVTYINDRLGGFAPLPPLPPGAGIWAGTRDALEFPEFYAPHPVNGSPRVPGFGRLQCTGPITYVGQKQVARDIDNLKAALEGAKAMEAFIPAISPSNVEQFHENHFYKTAEEYLFAIADALHEEYKAITDSGFLLQIDDPQMVTYYQRNPDMSIERCRQWAEVRVEAINRALRGIPEDRVRYHFCYSIDVGPRLHDLEMKHIADIMLKIRAGAYVFEYGNPRHEHEHHIWENLKLPSGRSLIPGVITHTSVLVEHPELVADRIIRFANLVGRENVIAGADCGFASFAGMQNTQTSIVWAKLKALAEGARIASRQLWR